MVGHGGDDGGYRMVSLIRPLEWEIEIFASESRLAAVVEDEGCW
jgi:hypothetical protein